MSLLDRQLKEGKTSHAYIFESEDLDEARRLADDFIYQLLDGEDKEKAFVRDRMLIRPDEKTIKISAIREMIDYFQSRPFYGTYKFAVIDEGDKLRKESSNAMLKILEDLPPYGKIIILVENSSSLLPTIRSRCQLVRLKARETYKLDVDFVEGLVESFILGDFSVIVKNKDKIEKMKDEGKDFFAIASSYLMDQLLQERPQSSRAGLEEAIDLATSLSKNLDNNVNFLLSVELFALVFIE